MSDWQVGDLALCVDASTIGNLAADAPKLLREGRAYRVAAVTPPGADWFGDYYGCGLILDGVVRLCGNQDFAARRFRKIRPDKHEDCELEFVELLQRIKRPEKVE